MNNFLWSKDINGNEVGNALVDTRSFAHLLCFILAGWGLVFRKSKSAGIFFQYIIWIIINKTIMIGKYQYIVG